MLTTQQIALWADKLRDVSALGLHYAKDKYDREHFAEVQAIAMAMFAAVTAKPVASLEPLRASLFARPTPLTAGDAAIINEKGEMLLIQRADNQMWAMPGGALEVGETAAEGVVREAREETGVTCKATAMVGVFDSRLCGTTSPHHMYHFVFLCEPLHIDTPAAASHAHEVRDVRWFAEDALPAPIDPGHVSRIPEAFRVWRGERQTFFDK